jgi:non-canonical (house-cleaning) NTP pyrophosphatase
MVIGGMVVVGTAAAMHKMTHEDAAKIEATTGKSPEAMEPEELEAAMAASGVTPQPVTAEDQQAMAEAEANDPNADEEVEAPE